MISFPVNPGCLVNDSSPTPQSTFKLKGLGGWSNKCIRGYFFLSPFKKKTMTERKNYCLIIDFNLWCNRLRENVAWARLPAAVPGRNPRSSPNSAGCVDLALLISTKKKSACLNRAGCLNSVNYLAVAKRLDDMKCDRVSRTFNQIPSTDILHDLNHKDICSTQNSHQTYMRESLYLNHVVPDCKITSKVNKERNKHQH